MAKDPSKLNKKVEAHKPRIRWGYIPAIVFLVSLPLDFVLFGPLDPGLAPTLNAATVFFLVSWSFLMLSLGWLGLEAGVHANSPQIFTPIGTWSMGDIAPVPVDSVPYGIDPYTKMAIPDADRITGINSPSLSTRGRTILDQMVDSTSPGQTTSLGLAQVGIASGDPNRRVLVVVDSKGKRVNKSILPLGGIKAFSIWFRPGSAGFIILNGDDELLRMGTHDKGEFAFVGKIPEPVDQNQLSESEIKTLRRFSQFTAESPVYVLKSWAGPYVNYVQASADAHKQMIDGSDLTQVSGSNDAVAVLNANLLLRGMVNYLTTRNRTLEETIRSGDQTMLGRRQRSENLYGGEMPGPGDSPLHRNTRDSRGRTSDDDQ